MIRVVQTKPDDAAWCGACALRMLATLAVETSARGSAVPSVLRLCDDCARELADEIRHALTPEDAPPSDAPNWSRLKEQVIERIDALAAIRDKSDAPPEWRAKIWNDLALPNLRLLAEFCTNIVFHDDGDDPPCFQCGHLRSDHPRDGRCGAALSERCSCQQFDGRREALTDITGCDI